MHLEENLKEGPTLLSRFRPYACFLVIDELISPGDDEIKIVCTEKSLY